MFDDLPEPALTAGLSKDSKAWFDLKINSGNKLNYLSRRTLTPSVIIYEAQDKTMKTTKCWYLSIVNSV